MSQQAAPSRTAVRTNRRWFLLILLCPIVVGIVVALEILTPGTAPEVSVRPVDVPAGYRAISDAYFGYAVPVGYRENNTWTDANGDYFYGDRRGWVAESLRVSKTAPSPGTDVPKELATFGQGAVEPYRLGPARRVTVRAAAPAYQYLMTRSDGFRATVVEVWEGESDTVLWLVVHAAPTTTAAVVHSLAGFQPTAQQRHAVGS